MRFHAIIAACAVASLSLAGCNTTASLDAITAAIQRSAPQACKNASLAYQLYVATDPTAKQLAKVNTYYEVIHDMCLHPSQITAEEVAFMTAKYYAMRKAMQ